MSPLDIPTIIPPSTVSESEILERVSNFLGRSERLIHQKVLLNHLIQPMIMMAMRENFLFAIEGIASIHLQTSKLSLKLGITLMDVWSRNSSGWLGLGITANPDESSQYDDVYTSYRKERSTNYHSSMSARTVR